MGLILFCYYGSRVNTFFLFCILVDGICNLAVLIVCKYYIKLWLCRKVVEEGIHKNTFPKTKFSFINFYKLVISDP